MEMFFSIHAQVTGQIIMDLIRYQVTCNELKKSSTKQEFLNTYAPYLPCLFENNIAFEQAGQQMRREFPILHERVGLYILVMA
jgi:hypothetical protein